MLSAKNRIVPVVGRKSCWEKVAKLLRTAISQFSYFQPPCSRVTPEYREREREQSAALFIVFFLFTLEKKFFYFKKGKKERKRKKKKRQQQQQLFEKYERQRFFPLGQGTQIEKYSIYMPCCARFRLWGHGG